MSSDVTPIDVALLQAAKNGCTESLSIITAQAKDKVFTFIFRMTLNHHLSEDLCQETMVSLIQSIQRLHFDHEEALWAWLFRTAYGKVQHYRRAQSSRYIDPDAFVAPHARTVKEPIAGLFRRETIEIIFQAMQNLPDNYRSVIILRCMNEMSYIQIATILGGTQLRSKMLFFRAKQALRRELQEQGMQRSHFFSALVAFASVTSWQESQASGAALISSSLSQVSVPSVLLATLSSKWIAVAASLLLIFGILTGFTNTTPHRKPIDPDSRFMSLLQDPNFAYPSTVIATHDPDNNGWTAIDGSRIRQGEISMACSDVLVAEPNGTDFRLILPAGHWVELGFAGPIVDGPGPDLFYTNWKCPVTRVFLTDGDQQLFELGVTLCNGNCNRFHIKSFDLTDVSLPFTPRAIRIVGLGHWNPQLTSIRARIQ